ncbi:MAG: hypothetical protein NW202_02445 [Nitrospira sp.]|nr:hypothetical protein [Nitrospira sp.]
MTYLIRFVVVWSCWVGGAAVEAGPLPSDHGGASKASAWERLVVDADRLHLPTNFLKEIPADFIQFEFDDLQTYAAEYHPDEHRMVLNRSLSFNGAARTLKPLAKMTHKELEVLYHELFHAYMDSLAAADTRTAGTGQGSNGLMAFARSQQVCRYADVTIVPIAQRPHEVEARYLTEAESWEALNETWAVFIGWAIWNQLELQQKGRRSLWEHPRQREQWVRRLEAAFLNGEFRGYYVPQDSSERRITHKRFLAKQSQLTWREAEVLLSQVFGFTGESIQLIKQSVGSSKFTETSPACEG